MGGLLVAFHSCYDCTSRGPVWVSFANDPVVPVLGNDLPSFEQDVHVFIWTMLPKGSFAELETFFVDLLAERPVVGCTSINAL